MGIVDQLTRRANELYDQEIPECKESLSHRDLVDEFNNGYGISYCFNSAGAEFIIYFPNVMKPCEESIFIPNKELDQYLLEKIE